MALYYCLSLSLYFTFTHQSYLENHSSSQHCNSTRGVGVNAKLDNYQSATVCGHVFHKHLGAKLHNRIQFLDQPVL